jgi:hypothetical protein
MAIIIHALAFADLDRSVHKIYGSSYIGTLFNVCRCVGVEQQGILDISFLLYFACQMIALVFQILFCKCFKIARRNAFHSKNLIKS